MEPIATPTNDSKIFIKFLKKNIFIKFGIPRALLSDNETDFCNMLLETLLNKYGVFHKVVTPCHPKQVVKSSFPTMNWGILEKTVDRSRKDWALKLDGALWAYQTTYKTLLDTISYWLVFRKCHLPIELEHKAYWAIKVLNLYVQVDEEKWFLQLCELDELILEAYESFHIYKEQTKH